MKKILIFLMIIFFNLVNSAFSFDKVDKYNQKIDTYKDDVLGKNWSQWINIGGKIPNKGFTRILFDSNTKEILETKTVDTISLFNYRDINAHYGKKTGIAGYWIGNIEIDKDGEYPLSVDNDWSNTRVIIDDTLLFEGTKSEIKQIKLNKGTHKIEVQFINSWHVVSFAVNLENDENISIYSKLKFKDENNEIFGENIDLYTVSAYESGNPDGKIDLNVTSVNSDKKFLLVLNSFITVNWNIIGENKNLSGIIFSSCSGISFINLDMEDIKLIRIADKICDYDNPKNIINGLFDNKEFKSLSNTYSTKIIGEIESYKKFQNNKDVTLEQSSEKNKYLKQFLLSTQNLNKNGKIDNITQIDKIVSTLEGDKLALIFNKIQKLKKKNDVMKYLESKIFLKLLDYNVPK